MDDDGHDPKSNPQEGLKKASDWLRVFLTTWLHFSDTTWVPKDEQMKRTLVSITCDESEGNHKLERIYTVFLGAVVNPQEITAAYNHYSVLRTIEDNFGLDTIHKESGDGTASVITACGNSSRRSRKVAISPMTLRVTPPSAIRKLCISCILGSLG